LFIAGKVLEDSIKYWRNFNNKELRLLME